MIQNVNIFFIIFKIIQHVKSKPVIYSSSLSVACMPQWIGSALVQVMACRLFGAKPLLEPTLIYGKLDPWDQTSVKFELKLFNNENVFKNVVCEMATIMSRGRWVELKQSNHNVWTKYRRRKSILSVCLYLLWIKSAYSPIRLQSAEPNWSRTDQNVTSLPNHAQISQNCDWKTKCKKGNSDHKAVHLKRQNLH